MTDPRSHPRPRTLEVFRRHEPDMRKALALAGLQAEAALTALAEALREFSEVVEFEQQRLALSISEMRWAPRSDPDMLAAYEKAYRDLRDLQALHEPTQLDAQAIKLLGVVSLVDRVNDVLSTLSRFKAKA